MANIQAKSYVGRILLSKNRLAVYHLGLYRAGENQSLEDRIQVYIARVVDKVVQDGRHIRYIDVKEDHSLKYNAFLFYLMDAGVIPNFRLPRSLSESYSEAQRMSAIERLTRDRRLSDLVWELADEKILNAVIKGERKRLKASAEEPSIQSRSYAKSFVLDVQVETHFLDLFRAGEGSPVTIVTSEVSAKLKIDDVKGSAQGVPLIELVGSGPYTNEEVIYLLKHGVLPSDDELGLPTEKEVQNYFVSSGDEYGRNRILAQSLSSWLWEANGEELITELYKRWIDRQIKLTQHDVMGKCPSKTIIEYSISILLKQMKAANYFPLKDEEIKAMRNRISQVSILDMMKDYMKLKILQLFKS